MYAPRRGINPEWSSNSWARGLGVIQVPKQIDAQVGKDQKVCPEDLCSRHCKDAPEMGAQTNSIGARLTRLWMGLVVGAGKGRVAVIRYSVPTWGVSVAGRLREQKKSGYNVRQSSLPFGACPVNVVHHIAADGYKYLLEILATLQSAPCWPCSAKKICAPTVARIACRPHHSAGRN